MGTWVHGELNRQTSLPVLRFEHSPIDMSAHPKGKAEREETFPACLLRCLCEAKQAAYISTETHNTRNKHQVKTVFFKSHMCLRLKESLS